ncbi:hypothetical protein [Listeria booriae]|uniref:Uncharacterized protein n=1 Tax=Listeria booriae TaxID=1552123 RepID=A0A7X0ZPE4_9LIST|nr:hypothetical protein [Listeria booriae]MBC2282849.1 hypothetical protein [Listeria booriae]MBC2291925.1 hypothetical protein [Listeria booriae]MBC2304959.1 hypothetical protein [Listeria booriae]MBC2310177.1 hypothetical protein [Listeria booriae]MBC2389484.1 hypothetical protein [Listeria booriae]
MRKFNRKTFFITYFSAVALYAIIYFTLNLSSAVNYVVIFAFVLYGFIGNYLIKKSHDKKNKLSKVTVGLLAFILVFGSVMGIIKTTNLPSTEPIVAKAIPVTTYNMRTHFTNAQCKSIVSQGSKLTKFSAWGSLLSGFSAPYLSAGLGIYGMTVDAQMKPFKNAISKKTGVTFKYKYVVPVTVTGGAGQVKDMKVSYEK